MLWWALLSGGVVLAERVPAPLLSAIGRTVAWLLATLPTAPRNRLRRNLARVTGYSLGDRRLDRCVRQAYATQVANYLDLLRIRVLAVPHVARRFTLEGPG